MSQGGRYAFPYFTTPTAVNIPAGPGKALYDSRQQQQSAAQQREFTEKTVNELRRVRAELSKEDWYYEAPRHTLG